MLDSLITSKTRLRLLIKFFISESNRGYLRGLAEEFSESTNSIRKELNQLTDAGYLIRECNDRKIFYRANKSHTLFRSLQSLIHNFLGLDQMVDTVFERAGEIEEVILLGEYASGIDSGHIEVLILGRDIDIAYVEQAAKKAEALVRKKISVYLSPPENIYSKIVLYQREEN